MNERMRTLEDLAEFTGVSVGWWYKQSASRSLPCTRFGKLVRFTDEQWEQTLALYASSPKVVPTRGQVAERRRLAVAR